MVYKKYITKGGKLHGPYYYESYRDGDKIKKRYLGTSLPTGYEDRGDVVLHSTSSAGLNLKPFYILGILAVALLLVVGAVYLAQNGNQMKVNQSKSVVVSVGGNSSFL